MTKHNQEKYEKNVQLLLDIEKFVKFQFFNSAVNLVINTIVSNRLIKCQLNFVLDSVINLM